MTTEQVSVVVTGVQELAAGTGPSSGFVTQSLPCAAGCGARAWPPAVRCCSAPPCTHVHVHTQTHTHTPDTPTHPQTHIHTLLGQPNTHAHTLHTPLGQAHKHTHSAYIYTYTPHTPLVEPNIPHTRAHPHIPTPTPPPHTPQQPPRIHTHTPCRHSPPPGQPKPFVAVAHVCPWGPESSALGNHEPPF